MRVDEHTCHHPTCDRRVPPKMLACRPHWYELPPQLRAAIWHHYRPGQEVDKRPSEAYLAVMLECVQVWSNQS